MDTNAHAFVVSLAPFQYGVCSMSVQGKAISNHCIKLAELEQQMAHILALRRALCLLNAKRNRAPGFRRGLHRVSRPRDGRPEVSIPPNGHKSVAIGFPMVLPIGRGGKPPLGRSGKP